MNGLTKCDKNTGFELLLKNLLHVTDDYLLHVNVTGQLSNLSEYTQVNPTTLCRANHHEG